MAIANFHSPVDPIILKHLRDGYRKVDAAFTAEFDRELNATGAALTARRCHDIMADIGKLPQS